MRVVTADGLELEAESFGDGPVPIVLIMGLGAQMLLWPDAFCAQLAARGHTVIRFDNRDVGASSRLDHLGTPVVPRVWVRKRLGLAVRVPYTLDDMARDALAVLDAYGLDRAAIVGASMGGMIAQRLVATAPERVRSFVSIMSATREMWPRSRALASLLRKPAPGREGYVEHTLAVMHAIGSRTHPPDEPRVRELAGRMFDRGPSPRGFVRQLGAVLASPDRGPGIAGTSVPGLVLHGDEDPLIPLQGGIETAKVAGARLHVVRGMGHDLPIPLWPEILDAISAHARYASSEEAP